MQHLSSKQTSPSPAAGLWRIVGCLTPEQTRRFTREIKLVSGALASERPRTGIAIEASGLDHPAVPVALGRYAVGALAGAVGLDARLAADMLATGVDARAELAATVVRLIGNTNVFTTEAETNFRDSCRNAWIAEMLMHAILVVRAHRDTDCLVGPVHAVSFPHDYPTIQGLDAVAVYVDADDPVVAIGESKASRQYGSGHLSSACDIFRDVDSGIYGTQLRQHLGALRAVIDGDIADRISDALWRTARCYVPAVVHETRFDPDAHRDRLASLDPPVSRRRVLVLCVADFHAFFDTTADAIRVAVDEVVV